MGRVRRQWSARREVRSNLLLDVDADGDLDILNTEEHDNAAGGNPGLGLVWYENPTRGTPQVR